MSFLGIKQLYNSSVKQLLEVLVSSFDSDSGVGIAPGLAAIMQPLLVQLPCDILKHLAIWPGFASNENMFLVHRTGPGMLCVFVCFLIQKHKVRTLV